MQVELVQPSIELVTPVSEIEKFPFRIEEAGRTCYRSEDRIGADTAEKFCLMLIKRGHESVLEHCLVSARIVCDRSTSHQLVRHRLCAFSQESQRYVAYRETLRVIDPQFQFADLNEYWHKSMELAALIYRHALDAGERPEKARAILPNCTATELVMSANLRQWRHVFEERAINSRAQGQIRKLMSDLLIRLHSIVPCLFGDIYRELPAD